MNLEQLITNEIKATVIQYKEANEIRIQYKNHTYSYPRVYNMNLETLKDNLLSIIHAIDNRQDSKSKEFINSFNNNAKDKKTEPNTDFDEDE